MGGILPTITDLEFDTTATTSSSTTDLGTTYQFDFNTGEFVMVDGKLVAISDTTALKQWVEKLLRTERFVYAIYARDDKNEYGVTLEDLIGSVLPRAFVEAELKREITEAVTRHPRITSITGLTTAQEGSKLSVAFTLVLDDGSTEEVTVSG